MNHHGIKRIGGKGYENRYLVVRKRAGREVAFFLLLLLFGGVVYLVASALFHSLFFTGNGVSVSFLF